jgi:hypothetical protein
VTSLVILPHKYRFFIKQKGFEVFINSDDSYCEVLNNTLCVLTGVRNACFEDEDNIFFQILGSYDKTARRYSVGLSVVCELYCRVLNFEVLCG